MYVQRKSIYAIYQVLLQIKKEVTHNTTNFEENPQFFTATDNVDLSALRSD